MKLINDIIEILSSENPSLENALIKTKVLLHRLGEASSIDWVNKELSGYGGDDAVPDYRKVQCSPIIDVTNGLTRWTGITPAIGGIPEAAQRYFNEACMRESISGLEYLTRGDGDTMGSSIPPEYWHFLTEALDSSINIEYARNQIVKSQILQITTIIRSRLLDFILALEEKVPHDLKTEDIRQMSDEIKAGDILGNAMFGDNATLIIGSNNTQTTNNIVTKNDIDDLTDFLSKNGVEKDDISILKNAITEDENDSLHQEGRFGSNVNDWMKMMLGKAVDCAWQIEIGVASGLLANALNQYYGF